MRDGKSDVYLIRRDGSQLRQLTRDGSGKGRAVWLPRGGLIYTAKTPAGWRAFRTPLDGGQPQALAAADGVVVIQRWADRLYARKDDDRRIYGMDSMDGRLRPLEHPIEVSTLEGWAPSPRGIYEVSPTGPEAELLSLHAWTGGVRSVASLKPTARMTLAADASGAAYAPQQTEDDVDLAVLELKPR